MDKEIHALINDQINFEFFSAYLYFRLENYYAEINLDGFANWFHVQSLEELDHGYLLCQYLHNNDQTVTLQSVSTYEKPIAAPKDAIKLAYGHEKQVTRNFHHIYEAALDKKDFRTTQLLDWFIKEQGEEEKSASDLLSKMNLFGADPKGLYLLNSELAARVYTPPTLVL